MSNNNRTDQVMNSSNTSLLEINYRNNTFVDKDLSTNATQTHVEEPKMLETSWCSDTSSNSSEDSDEDGEDHNIWEKDCEWQVRELMLQSEQDQETIEQNVFSLLKFRSLHWDLKKQPGSSVQKFNEKQLNEQIFETMKSLCLQNIENVNKEVFHSFMKPVHMHSNFLAFKQLHSNLRTNRHLTHTHHKDTYIQSLGNHRKLRHRSFLKNKISEQLHTLQTSQTHQIASSQHQSGGLINNLNNFKSTSHASQQFKRTDNRSYTQAPRLHNTAAKAVKPTLEDFADLKDGLTQADSADQNISQKASQIEQKQQIPSNLIHHKAIISQSTKTTAQQDVLLRYISPNDQTNQKISQSSSLIAKNNISQTCLSSKPGCAHFSSVQDSVNQNSSSKNMIIFSSPLIISSEVKATTNQSTPNTIRESTIKEQQLSLHCSPQINKLSMLSSKVITPPNQAVSVVSSLNLFSQKKIPQKDSFLLPSIIGQTQPKRLSPGNDLMPVKSLKESTSQSQTNDYQHKAQQSNQSMPICSQEKQFSIPLKFITSEQQANISNSKNSIVINSFRHRHLKNAQQAQDEQSVSFAQENSIEKNIQTLQTFSDKASSFNSHFTNSTQYSSSTTKKQFTSTQNCYQSHLSVPDTPQSQLSNLSPSQTTNQTIIPSLPAKKICSSGNLSSQVSSLKNTTPMSKTQKHINSVSDSNQSKISNATLSTFSEHVSYLDRNSNKNCLIQAGEINSRENLSEQSLYQLNHKNQYQTPLSLRAQLKMSATSSLLSSQKRNDESLIKADISSVSSNQSLFFAPKVPSPQPTKQASPFQDDGRITNKIFNQLKDQRLKVFDSPNVSKQPFQRGKPCAPLFQSQIAS